MLKFMKHLNTFCLPNTGLKYYFNGNFNQRITLLIFTWHGFVSFKRTSLSTTHLIECCLKMHDFICTILMSLKFSVTLIFRQNYNVISHSCQILRFLPTTINKQKNLNFLIPRFRWLNKIQFYFLFFKVTGQKRKTWQLRFCLLLT